jgi:ubiquinone biosynthesis protein
LWVVAQFARLIVILAARSVVRLSTVEDLARRIRERLEEIGGLWVMAGQLLALRIDLFPPALCRELSRLQGRRIGFSTQTARRIIEADLGAPLDQIFDEFSETPFAAVPMGQVHRARLRTENVWVAVKVQTPWSAELFAGDLRLMRWLVRVLLLLRVYPRVRWQEGLAELEQLMREELDFHYEASAMRRMRRTLRRHGLVVPGVYAQYCSPRVLVSEFIHAVLMADYMRLEQNDPAKLQAWLRENKIEPRRVAGRLLSSLFRQLLEDNLYHGNMHPGNIVLLRNSRIALIDFRIINFTEREYLQKYRLFLRALATRDYAKAADLGFMLCAILPVIDIEMVKERVVRELRAWATRTLVRELPYEQRSIDQATVVIVGIMSTFGCTMDWGWLRIHRAMATLDVSLARLRPRLNHTRQAARYFRRAHGRSLAELGTGRFAARALGSVRTALDIQDRVNEYTMFQGSLIRRHAQVFQGATNKFADTFATLIGALALLILLPGIAVVALLAGQRWPGVTDGLLGSQIAGWLAALPRLDTAGLWVLLAVDVYFFVAFVRLKRRLRQKDVRHHERVAAV